MRESQYVVVDGHVVTVTRETKEPLTPERLRELCPTPDFDTIVEAVERGMISAASKGDKRAFWKASWDSWCHHRPTVEAIGKKYEKAGFVVSYYEDGLEISWRHSQ